MTQNEEVGVEDGIELVLGSKEGIMLGVEDGIEPETQMSPSQWQEGLIINSQYSCFFAAEHIGSDKRVFVVESDVSDALGTELDCDDGNALGTELDCDDGSGFGTELGCDDGSGLGTELG